MSEVRLQKFLADAGIASRRKSEEFIKGGQVKVNGVVVREMGIKIDPEKDSVKFLNNLVKLDSDLVYIILNKPVGYVSTTRSFKEEKNILSLVRIDKRIYPIGRLDKDTSGLLLLTNDGDFALKMTHPRYEKEKEYEVKVNKEITDEDLKKLGGGVRLEEGKTLSAKIKRSSKNSFNIVLKEGKKRQIRMMCRAFNYQVLELKRIRIGNLRLNDLRSGKWRYLNKNEIKDLR